MTPSFTRSLRGIASAIVAFGMFPVGASASDTFRDVPTTSEFHGYIHNLHQAGVISGVTPTTFEPMRNITRGEVAKVVVRAKGMTINTAGGPHFNDVGTTHDFYSYIETLANANVVSGYGDNNYRPQWNVTRGEFSKIVTRTWNMPIDMTGAPHFDDLGEASGSYQYVETLYNNGIINGYPDKSFRQDNPILRQEVAKMIDRTMKKGSFNTGTGARLNVVGNPGTLVADCTTTSTIRTTTFDAYGNEVSTFTGPVTVTTSLGRFANGTNTTTVNATAGTATFQLSSCTAGVATLTASAEGYPTTTRTVTFTGSGTGNRFVITATPSSVVGDCTTTSTIAFSVVDQAGNALTSFSGPVTATTTTGRFVNASGGSASTGTASKTVQATNGTGTFYLSSCDTGTGTITFSSPNVSNNQATVSFTAPGTNGQNLNAAANPTSVAANCVSDSTITVTARDNANNTVTSYTGAISGTASMGRFSNGNTTQTVNAVGGVATFEVSSCTAGTGTMTFTATGYGTTNVPVTFTSASQEAEELTVAAAPMTAAGNCTATSTVTVRAVDEDGNVLAGYNGVIAGTISSGAGEYGSNANSGTTTQNVTASNGTGVFTVSSCEAGATTYSFTTPGVTTPETVTVTFT